MGSRKLLALATLLAMASTPSDSPRTPSVHDRSRAYTLVADAIRLVQPTLLADADETVRWPTDAQYERALASLDAAVAADNGITTYPTVDVYRGLCYNALHKPAEGLLALTAALNKQSGWDPELRAMAQWETARAHEALADTEAPRNHLIEADSCITHAHAAFSSLAESPNVSDARRAYLEFLLEDAEGLQAKVRTRLATYDSRAQERTPQDPYWNR
jgi:hypothetical protein